MKRESVKNSSAGCGPRVLFLRGIIAACIVSAASLTGCLYFHTRVTGLEPQAKLFENRHYTVLGEAEGKSSSFNLLWFIPVTPRISYEEAVNQAVSSRNGDNLIEVRTWQERQIWILGLVEILYVRGKVIRYERTGQPQAAIIAP